MGLAQTQPVEPPGREVDAAQLVARVQANRNSLRDQLDMAEVIIESLESQIANLLKRIDELEDRA